MAPKAKKPLSAKAKLKLKEAKAAEKQRLIDSGEYVEPAAKPVMTLLKKKVLASLGGKSVEEATTEYKTKMQDTQKELNEAQAAEAAQVKKVEEATAEYEKVKAEVATAMEQERASAAGYKDLTGKRSEMTKKVDEARKELYEGQKKQAMLEVLAVNHAKMKMLEETRKRAQEAAEAAKKNMLENKQREKEALEATRRALAETRAEQKGFGKGLKKRMAEDFPETQTDSTQAADID